MTIAYGNTNSATSSNLKSYLTPSSATNTEDIQFCTINDTTFINNRTKEVTIDSATTAARPHTYGAYVELLRTENGRQYALNVHDGTSTETSLVKATRVKIESTTLSTGWGTGNCPGIGIQVFGDGDYTAQSGKKHLVFRITTLGQVGDNLGDDDGNPGTSSYRCAYSKNVDLLHGGEGWDTNDEVTVTLDSAATNYNYTIKVTDHEETKVRGTINSGVNGIIRPSPTPWDSQTSVSPDTILGGLYAELAGTGLSRTIIGNGIYLSSSAEFHVEVCDPDLMRVMQHEINDVSKLPSQCKNGYIVKVSNSQQSEEDDYYLKFAGQGGKDGPGSWEECAKPGIKKKLSAGTMPVTIQRTGTTTFTVDRYVWDERTVGDDRTNSIPTFVSINNNHPDYNNADDLRYINKVLFFRNRLTFLSGPSVITSQPGDFGNFWSDTALTVSGIDPIDISMSSTLPSKLFDGLEINAGLLVFTTNSQHLLASDDTVFNPDTAKLRTISAYNYNKIIPPISLGTTIGFLDNSNKYSRFNETANISREGQAMIIDQTKVVPTLLPKGIDLLTNSRENGLTFFAKTGEDIVYGFKTVTVGEQRLQSAWFKWKLNNPIKYHFVEDDKYYFLDTDNFLQSINLTQNDADPSIDEEGINYLIHLDNWTTVQGGSYNNTTNKTTFTDGSSSCEFTWQSSVTSPNGDLVVIDIDSGTSRVGKYAPVTVTSAGTSFTVPGDWSSSTLYIGYLYDYQVDFPRLYTTKQVGQNTVADTSASLVLHRLNLSLGKVGLYETTLTRVGKDPYTEIYESTPSNLYNVSDAPYVDEVIRTIPVYDKNKNVDITLKSTHPSPCTLRSMQWEGDYSPMYYRRG